ncbi:DUF433 domain-containing protein [Phytomonospora sp. NPDC050363]|uniref:DUF433 domain-containing protein n=1 Tax=Phytomonospora sp. NPDC050363 TaxID=3155642 RepID=UPI00340D1247
MPDWLEGLRDRLPDPNEWVTSDPGIRGGEPCVKGTRLPALQVTDLLNDGVHPDAITEHYPGITGEIARGVWNWHWHRPEEEKQAECVERGHLAFMDGMCGHCDAYDPSKPEPTLDEIFEKNFRDTMRDWGVTDV